MRQFVKNLYRVLEPPGATRYIDWESPGVPRVLREFIDDSSLILSIGSGRKKYGKNVICLDLVRYPSVNVVADGEHLPFKAKSFEKAVIQEVLEHVGNPEEVMAEVRRILKVGGRVFCDAPFMFPYHPNPYDLRRYSLDGLVKQFEECGFVVIQKGIDMGPSSLFCLVLRYYLSLLTSFNRARLFNIGWLFWGWLTFWIKYLDSIVAGWKNGLSDYISAGVYVVAEKQ